MVTPEEVRMEEESRPAQPTQESCYEALSKVMDPELGLDVVCLGLIYSVSLEGTKVSVEMTMTSPGCPLSDQILFEANNELLKIPGVEKAHITLVWTPPWTPEMMSLEAKMSLGYA
jgi:metal-sulfur cluster biosynthetic enzyme